MNIRANLGVVLTLVVAIWACSDDTATTDVGVDESDVWEDTSGLPDSQPDSMVEDTTSEVLQEVLEDTIEDGETGGPENSFEPIGRTEPIPDLDPSGHADIVTPLSEGEVRAGVILDWNTTFGGVETDCRPGDFKIYNELVQFCIAGTAPINLWMYSGGNLIDADRVGADDDRLFLTAGQNHVGVPGASSVEVIADGRDGLAVIRVIGPEEPLRVLTEAVGMLFPLRGVSFETEYRLRPGDMYLEMVTWIRAERGHQGVTLGDIVAFGDTTSPFFANFGRERPALEEVFPFVAATTQNRSYALYSPDGYAQFQVDISELYSDNPYLLLVSTWGMVPQEEEGAYRRYFIIDDGGTDGIRRTIAEIEGVDLPGQAIVVTTQHAGSPEPDVGVVVRNSEGRTIDSLVTDGSGEARLEVDAGAYSVQLEGWRGGSLDAIELTVEEGSDFPVTFNLPVTATISITVEATEYGEDVASPSPAKVLLSGPASYRFFTTNGLISERVQPGTYRVEVTRGEEFSAEVFDSVEVPAGQTTQLEASIERLWNTEGLISGDFHQHCTRSPDSFVTEIERVLTNVVEGVDFIVPSDHEAVTDFTPQIAELGVENLVFSMPSTEVSPVFTHLNPMPMPYDPTLPAGGGFSKASYEDEYVQLLTFPEIVTKLREDYGVSVIQINHPRGGAALFDYGNYDPLLGPEETDSARFVMDFDSIEVFNSRSDFCQIFNDWLGFVARGYSVTGVGNSDTHSLNGEPGYPRNYLPSPASVATEISNDQIIDGILSGNISVSGGALITFPGGPELGSLLNVSAEATFDLPILIQTPTWSTVERALVIVGGDIVGDIALDVAAEEVIVLDQVLTLNRPLTDNYLIVVAYGNTRMPIGTSGQRPFGFTNPIFLDVDGDDAWTPPGIASMDDLVAFEIPWCN